MSGRRREGNSPMQNFRVAISATAVIAAQDVAKAVELVSGGDWDELTGIVIKEVSQPFDDPEEPAAVPEHSPAEH